MSPTLRYLSFCLLAFWTAHADAGDGEILFINSFEGTGNVPQFVPVDDQAGVENRLLLVDIDTSEPANQLGILFSLTDAPSGMTINDRSGEIRWTPTSAQIGPDSVTVQAEDLEGLSNTLTFNVEIVDGSAAPLIAPIPDQTITVGDSYLFAISASDPDPGDVLLYELVSPPAGLLIDPVSGELSWTPLVGDIGSYTIRVRVSDPSGAANERLFELRVINANQAPVIDPLPDRGAIPGVLSSIQASAVDPDGGSVTYTLSIRPTGMIVDPMSGVISWTPAVQQLGPHPVTVVATDEFGASAETAFEVFVDMNRAPVAVDDGVFEIERDDILTVAAPGVLINDDDPNGDPLTALLVDGPTKGSLSLNADGSFEYIPNQIAGQIGFNAFEYRLPSTQGPNTPPLVADMNDDGRTDVFSQVGVSGADSQFIVTSPESGDPNTGLLNADLIATSPLLDRGIASGSGKAIADIDLDGFVEIISVGGEPSWNVPDLTQLIAFEHDGTFKWESEPLAERYVVDGIVNFDGDGHLGEAQPTIADLDQDGIPEIIIGHPLPGNGSAGRGLAVTAFDNQGIKLFTGFAREIPQGYTGVRVEVVDLDLDGDLEILAGSAAFSHTGELLWTIDTQLASNNFAPRATPLAANLDNDPFPELVRSGSSTETIALNHDGTELWTSDTLFSFAPQDAELVIADVDDDGPVEVLVTGDNGLGFGRLEVLNGADGSLKWEYPGDGTFLNLANVAPTVFDLDGDGNTEVLAFDASTRIIWVLDGETGDLIGEFDLGLSGRQAREAPFFADVDDDGASELLLYGPPRFGPSGAYWVLEAPNDDWAPTRSIWNQWNYHVTNVNEDGTIPQFEQQHWLLPGLNRNRVNSPLPEDRLIEDDQFTYRANDGRLQSNVATVDIRIFPPNTPPRIVSSPRTSASPGFEYVYPALALDADIGDTLSWSIGDGPAGMTVDAQGTVRWTPGAGDSGENAVVLQVADQGGLFGYQFFTIEVRDPSAVPDVTGLTELQAIDAVSAADLVADPLLRAFSDTVPEGQVISQDPSGGALLAAGGSVEIVVSRGPVPLPVPDVITQTLDNATGDILLAGFSVGTITFVNDELQPANTVLVQDPAPQSLALPGTPIDITVSGGPRAEIGITPRIIPAGQTANVTVIVRDTDGTPLDPQPDISLSLDVAPTGLVGTPPMLSGSEVTTNVDSQGSFRVVATFNISGVEEIAAEAVVTQLISDGEGANVFGEFAEQLETFDQLIGQLIEAVNTNDAPTILAIDSALEDLLDDIDLDRLSGLTPIAPEGGVPPSPATAAQNGFPPGNDDAAYRAAALDLFATLEEAEEVVSGGTAPDPVLNMLNQELGEVASVISGLEPDVYGVLHSSEVLIALLGTRAPQMLVADIEAVRRELRDSGVISADGSVSAGRFSLGGVMTASQIRTKIIKDVYAPYLGDVARAMGTLIGADLLQAYANEGSIVGVITGASQSIQVFEIDNSVIEGLGFDTLLPEGNSVTIVGPELIDAVLDIINQDLPQASDLKDLNKIKDAIQAEIDLANNLVDAVKGAVSSPDQVLRGCLFDSRPECRQLLYPNGFDSVYKVNGGLSLPAPVIFIVYNLAGGSFGVSVAPFVPTRED